MGDRVVRERHAGEHVIDGRTLEVVELTWRDAAGRSYDVMDSASGACLTEDESFDSYPSVNQLRALIPD